MEPINSPVPAHDLVSSTPGYYTCKCGPGVPVHLCLDALEEISADVMAGFGAIPRRGVEVGGVLLGRIREGEIWIESFAKVACEHRRGPSYLLSERDLQELAGIVEQNRSGKHIPVGLFRSNTRDQTTITDEDRALFARYFPPPTGTFLLIRPFATKTSMASFLAYENGVLPDSNPDTFPFLRWELEGGSAPRRRPLNDGYVNRPANPSQEDETPAPAETDDDAWKILLPRETQSEVLKSFTGESIPASRGRGWRLVAWSLLMLLLGVLIGFECALKF